MNRTDVINHVIAARGLTSYLEIGIRNPADNFNRIDCPVRLMIAFGRLFELHYRHWPG